MFTIAVTSNIKVPHLAVNCLGFRVVRIVHLSLRLGMDRSAVRLVMDRTIEWLGRDRVAVLLGRGRVTVSLDRDPVTGVVRVLCLVQTPDCLTARDLCLGQVLSYHCLMSCIKNRM